MKAHTVHAQQHGRQLFEGEVAGTVTEAVALGIPSESHSANPLLDGVDMASYMSADLDAVSNAPIIPILLRSLADMAGLRLAAVVCDGGKTGITCAVEDRITALPEPGYSRKPARSYLNGWTHPATAQERFCNASAFRGDAVNRRDACLCTPIILAEGRIFGTLCAVRTTAANATGAEAKVLLTLFAGQIGLAIDHEIRRARQDGEQRQLHAATELTEQFVAILGHDLRNPLQAISVISELLERQLSDPGHLKLISRMRQSTRRMSALIDDILDFARVRLGSGLGVEMKEIDDLDAALLDVTRELQDGHPNRRLVASVDIHRPVNCDSGRLQQLVSNLLANALTHGHPDSVVRFTASADESYLALEVWNDGEPIPAESLDQLFMPFWRNKLASHRTGLGLGLHICDQIVRAHRGVISVHSDRKTGTTFTARLPLGLAAPAASVRISA